MEFLHKEYLTLIWNKIKNKTKMIKHLQKEKESLRFEIKAIDYTCSIDNLKMTKIDKIRIIELKAQIRILNKVIMSWGVQKNKNG